MDDWGHVSRNVQFKHISCYNAQLNCHVFENIFSRRVISLLQRLFSNSTNSTLMCCHCLVTHCLSLRRLLILVLLGSLHLNHCSKTINTLGYYNIKNSITPQFNIHNTFNRTKFHKSQWLSYSPPPRIISAHFGQICLGQTV